MFDLVSVGRVVVVVNGPCDPPGLLVLARTMYVYGVTTSTVQVSGTVQYKYKYCTLLSSVKVDYWLY